MNLEELRSYKNQFFGDILTDEKIVHLIDPDMPLQNADKLMYDNVYPSLYVPDTVEQAKTFVCCDVDFQVANVRQIGDKQLYYCPIMYVWIFTHKSLMKIPDGGFRVDELAIGITDKIAGSKFYTMGALTLYSAKRFAPMVDFVGKVLAFNGRDWNEPSAENPNRPIPSNRRAGV